MTIFQRYFDGGYGGSIHPVGPGLKNPSLPYERADWDPDKQCFNHWVEWGDASWNKKPPVFDPIECDEHGSGVCLLMRPQYDAHKFVGFDLDFHDLDMAKKVASHLIHSIGEGLCRVRDGIPRLLVYRAEGNVGNFNSVYFRREHDSENKVIPSTKEQVDFITATQVVLEGWHHSGSIQTIPNFMAVQDLPIVDRGQLILMWNQLLEMKPPEWTVSDQIRVGRIFNISDDDQRRGIHEHRRVDLPPDHIIRVTGTRLEPIDIEVTVAQILEHSEHFIGMNCYDPFYWEDQERYGNQPRIGNIDPNTVQNSWAGPVVIRSHRRKTTYFLTYEKETIHPKT